MHSRWQYVICRVNCCRLINLLQQYSTFLMQSQKNEKNHEQLAKIGKRTDEIKDLHTRHELTVKRNREVKPASSSAPTGLVATWGRTSGTK